MNSTIIKEFAMLAKKKPTLATLVVMGGIVVWVCWAHFIGMARADDMQDLATKVQGTWVSRGNL